MAANPRHEAIHKKALELLDKDPELKVMALKSPYPAFKAALSKAAKEIPRGQADVARSQGDASLSRDDRLRAVALTLLKTDDDLCELAKSDRYGAFKRALKAANTKLKGFEGEWARAEADAISLTSKRPATPATESPNGKRRQFRQGENGRFRVSISEGDGLPLWA